MDSGSLGRTRLLSSRQRVLAVTGVVVFAAAAAAVLWPARHGSQAITTIEISSQSKRQNWLYRPTEAEWASLVVEPAEQRSFRMEQTTEGKIAIDEDRTTPVFSPFSGRVTKLLVKPGDEVQRGQPLFVIEATDTVQGLNDFMSAMTSVSKARSQLTLAQTVEKRARDLYEGKAAPLKELQQAQAELVAAQNDLRSSETTLEAARNRLRILGRNDEEIAAFQSNGKVSPETPINAPISGTIVQRKAGPGQYLNAGTSDPVFVIGDLSSVWLTAFIRETDAGKARVGTDISFNVLAYPDRVYSGKVNYVAASLDPASRRLLVRATVDNRDGLLKPEMFASVVMFEEDNSRSVAVPRSALIYDGSLARAWIARDDKSIELRQVKTGLTSGGMIQVLDGIAPGERVITKGSLFLDRAAVGS